MEYKLTNCILCNNTKLIKLITFNSTPLGDSFKKNKNEAMSLNRYNLDLMMCNKCKHIQLSTIVAPEDVYDEEYLYTTDISHGLSEHFQKSANNIISKFNVTKNDLVIEIGSNKGIMLNEFKKNNINILGIEPAKYAAECATQNGIDTINDFFNINIANKIIKTDYNIKVILANNVMANIPNLNEFFQAIEILLRKDDGVFIFETSYAKDVFEKNLIDTIYHEHISYFSLYSLHKELEKFGLKLYDAEHIKPKGGSIRGYISKINSPKYSTTDRLNQLLKQEIESNFWNNKIDKNIKVLENDINEYIKFLYKQNHKIICYGASVGCTTMIYNLGLQKCDILLDDNKLKIGKYSPGLGIKVEDSNYIYTENIQYVIVLAWRYIEQIMQKHTKFLKKGGKFILIDLPNNKLVEYKNG